MTSMKLSRKRRNIVIAVCAVAVALTAGITAAAYHNDYNAERHRAELNAQIYAERIQSDFERGIAITESLESILLDNNGVVNDFDSFAAGMMEEYISSIQLAPNGVVTDIYPLQGNETGKINLFEFPDRAKVSAYARDHNMITMHGPFNLKQGGQGIAIRNPVFLTEADGSKKFWGFAVVIIKCPEIYGKTMDELQSFGFNYVLDVTNSLISDEPKRVSASIDDGATLPDASAQGFEIGECAWTISVSPIDPTGSNRWVIVLIGLLVATALITAMTYMLLALRQSREELESTLQQAIRASEGKTHFVSSMSHDIRSPLNAVLGLAGLAQDHIDNPEKMRYYLDQINVAGKQLLAIINDVLEVSHIENGKVEIDEEPVDVTEVVRGIKTVFASQAAAKDIRLSFVKDVEHRYLYVDRTHIEEIYSNLISNAIKYTPEGGNVEVRITELRNCEAGRATIRATISDDGIGMSKQYQEKLFQQFERERAAAAEGVQGTGLGLSIVKKLVDMMGGTIETTSEQGVGTTFTLTLTHRIAEAPENETVDEFDEETLVGKHVLLAEDIDINAMIAQELLTSRGMKVQRVRDGRECVDTLAMALPDYFDVVLMDIQMPNMDGYSAAKKIRKMDDQKKAGIPIIAMTANAFKEDHDKVMDAGMNDHVAKPIDVTQLFTTLAKHLN